MDAVRVLAKEFSLNEARAGAVVGLIDEGNTIPFIARYRKEATGSLDDQVLREMGERLTYLRGLDKRRGEIAGALTEQGALTDELSQKLEAAQTLAELEDLYRPYKPKRRTRATVARERGLEPLALFIMAQQGAEEALTRYAARFVGPDVPDAQAALAGARDILAEMMADDADARRKLRALAAQCGVLESKAAKDEDSVYRLYYDFSEPVARVPGYRVLAINRGEREEYLRAGVRIDEARAKRVLREQFIRDGSGTAQQLDLTVDDAWKRLIEPALEREIRADLTERAGTAAVRVFGQNLRQLLMQPPVRGRVTLGVDPGFRTGCKLAVVDETGKVLETGVGHFTIPGQTMLYDQAKKQVAGMIARHGVTAVAIGNGTASREAEAFIAQVLGEMGGGAQYAIVSEAGASVYSASKLAAEEFPQFDVSLRSAVSIARRLQDPLAELVKIDPKAVGVGQYQHDLKDAQLTQTLDGVVEDCVNAVGVEVSTASASLLAHVAGIGPALARGIVAYREENGIASRAQLKKVPKLGPRAFEQCAGFLRVRDSRNVLDATGVHPESYKAAEALIERLGYRKEEMRGGAPADLAQRAQAIGLKALAGELGVGEPTLADIVRELMKPGRDPRDELPPTLLRRDVLAMEDLQPGMELTGTVRNVVDFGAFVDIGVHQDGLVHISRMANRFIRHPSEAVKLGDVVKVWVTEVDVKKKRIALSMIKP